MFSREPRIREAILQTDGAMRVTVEFFGRPKLLTFRIPPCDRVEAPADERGVDLDGGEEDGYARLIIDAYAMIVEARYRDGEIPDGVDELPESPDTRGQIMVCDFWMGQRRWR